MSLLWFHATRRSTPSDYVRLLQLGLGPAPHAGETKQLELHLAIAPHRVYCYLGRTREAFGDFCVVLRPDQVREDGEISPFDTGGLVHKIEPVCNWEQGQQQEYLSAFTFATSTREDCLARYPNGNLRSYLDGARPPQSGPHAFWAEKPEAEVWVHGTDWRAWTWEGRWEDLKLVGQLFAWTCAPSLFAQILEATESASDIAEEHIDDFIRKYQPGGVGALVADLKAVQVP